MSDLPPLIGDVARHLLGEPNQALSTARQWRYGTNGSLAVEVAGDKRGTWFDHELGKGGGVLDLVHRETGLADGAAVEWLKSELDIRLDEQPNEKPKTPPHLAADGGTSSPSEYAERQAERAKGFFAGKGQKSEDTCSLSAGFVGKRRIVATYDYHDEAGELLFQVVRYRPKHFKQRRPDGKGGWVWSVKGVRQVPYRLNAILERPEGCPVFVVEGEKDVDRLVSLGLVATCNAGGAGKWRPELSAHLRGATTYILPDNHDTGHQHAQQVAASLLGTAESVRVVELPGLPHKGDVTDWLDAGGTVEQLLALCEAARLWSAEAEAPRPEAEARDQPTTEDALALAFAKAHTADLRFVAGWSRWLRWDGSRWCYDDTLHAYDMVRHTCREARKALPPSAPARTHAILASAKTVAAVERLAKADRRLAGSVDHRNPDILNTPGGVVDLRTGALRPHAQPDYCTKITAVSPAPPGTDCPLWRAFLGRIMGGDGELICFLQRVAGYALTGLTIEHALFFFYGVGANGKGTWLNTLTAIMGDYAAIASMETFSESHSDRHPTDLAALRGARLVVAQETERGRRWAEAKIKALTGGDPVTARFMRQDFFTYVPEFKLVVAGNHKPGLQGVDEAIRRRLNLVPFNVTIPSAERDLNLAAKLKSEWPAILRWAIDGCLEWRRCGLDQPQAVLAATDEYLADEDVFARWLGECCQRSSSAHETTADLFASWRKYCERTGEHAGTEKGFRENLKQRDFVPKRQGGTGRSGFAGILLVRPDYTDDRRYGG